MRSNIAKAATATIPVFAALVLGGSPAAEASTPTATYNAACDAVGSTTATYTHPPQHVTTVHFVWRDSSNTIVGDLYLPSHGHSVSAPTPRTSVITSVNWLTSTNFSLGGVTTGCSNIP